MRFVILTTGTRGDVQPFAALAQGLSRAGHSALLAAPASFAPFIESLGVSFAPMGTDYSAVMASPEGKAALSGNPVKAMQVMKQQIFPMMRRMLQDAWAAAQGADAIIYHPKVMAGVHLAEKLQVPCFIGTAVPIIVPTRAFPAPAFIGRDLGGLLNRLTYSAVRAGTRPFRGLINTWRREQLGLGPRVESEYQHNGRPIPVLHAFSAAAESRISGQIDSGRGRSLPGGGRDSAADVSSVARRFPPPMCRSPRQRPTAWPDPALDSHARRAAQDYEDDGRFSLSRYRRRLTVIPNRRAASSR